MLSPRSTFVVLVGSGASLLGCGAPPSEDVTQSGQAVTATDVYNFGAIAHSGSCLDAQAGGTSDGTQLQEWTCNGTGAQSYQMVDAGNGAVNIVNTQANKCVDVQGAGTANGTKVQLYDCNQTGAQSFFTTDAGDGFLHFVNTNSGKCLDVTADNPSDGTRVQLYDCNGTNAQRWNPSVVGTASPPSGGGGGTTPPGWQLTWSDEFDGPDGSGVDPSKWRFDIGGNGWGNEELEYYTYGLRTPSSRRESWS